MELSVTIPIREFAAVERLLAIIETDDRSWLGQLRLRANGSRRRWEASDSYRAAAVTGDDDSEVYDVAISPSLVAFAFVAAGDADQVTVHVATTATGQRIGVVGPGGSLYVDQIDHDYPDLDDVALGDIDVMARATVRADRLFALVNSRRARVTPGDDEDQAIGSPPYWLQITGGELQASVYWQTCGNTDSSIPAETGGEVAVQLNPRYLESLIRLFDPDDRVEVRVPRWRGRPIQLVGERCVAALMPLKSGEEMLRIEVEATIEHVAGHLATVRDDDGDYPLHRHSTRVYGRLLTGTSPPLLQVFAVVLADVEPGSDLFAELNDLNSTTGFARLFHVERQVLAEVELVAGTLDALELSAAIERITDIAARITPMLAAVFGGRAVEDPAAFRWHAYRTTIIDAEVTPGALVALNGADAVPAWPFPGDIHVLTGWNPQGISLGDSSHENVNIRIAEDILRHGGRFVHGNGRSPSGDHMEPSLIAFNLTRDDAITIAHRASQDAIFELTNHEMRLISCTDGKVDSWDRSE